MDKNAVNRAFKAYDIRGKIPDELNEKIVKNIGNAYVQFLKNTGSKGNTLVIGYDVRKTSDIFAKSFAQGVTDAGFNVINIGLVGTDMVYFATGKHDTAGGVMITASHNPPEYNGIKFVRENAIAISSETGLLDIRDIVLKGNYVKVQDKGTVSDLNVMDDYVDFVLSFVDISKFRKMKVVMNAGNGCAGVALKNLMPKIPVIETIEQFWEPDGSFPNGIPNPLLHERRADTIKLVKSTNADIGVAWDGDFDRCFFVDENGDFVEGYYLVQLFGQYFAKRNKGAKIIHDARLIWGTIEAVEEFDCTPVASKAGHTFIKNLMREIDAVYAGEMSAHHYFRDNFYADNGMIPMLLLFEIMGETHKSLSELVYEWKEKYPISGEINIRVKDQKSMIQKIEAHYKTNASEVSHIDGISITFDNWRFNLRVSNTEPVIRLNLETRGDFKLMESKRDEILTIIKELDAK